jgi:hypothetical protein
VGLHQQIIRSLTVIDIIHKSIKNKYKENKNRCKKKLQKNDIESNKASVVDKKNVLSEL